MTYEDGGRPLFDDDEDAWTDDAPYPPERSVAAESAPIRGETTLEPSVHDSAREIDATDDPSIPTTTRRARSRRDVDARLASIGWLRVIPNAPSNPPDMHALTDPTLPSGVQARAWIDRARAMIEQHVREGGTPSLNRSVTARVDYVERQTEVWSPMIDQIRQAGERRYHPPAVVAARDAVRAVDRPTVIYWKRSDTTDDL